MATATQATGQIVDFSNVKDGGGSFNKKRMPEGDYLAKITLCVDSPTKETKEAQWLYTLEIQSNSQKFPYYCKLVENQLWKLRNLFLAAGIQVPKKKVKVDPNKIVGKMIGVTLEDDEYDGKAQSNIAAVFPASDLTAGDDDADDLDDEDDEEDEEEEAPAPPAKKKAAKKAPEPEPEEDEDDDEDDDEEEEDEDEEPAPAPVVKKKAKATVPAQVKKVSAKKKAPAVTEDDLEELDLDDI